jgi:hypothetical protein
MRRLSRRRVVEERSRTRRSPRVTEGGVPGSENADMSNDKGGEIPPRRKPEVSWAMLIIPGLVGT